MSPVLHAVVSIDWPESLATPLFDDPFGTLVLAGVWFGVAGLALVVFDRVLCARSKRDGAAAGYAIARSLRWPLVSALFVGGAYIIVRGLIVLPRTWHVITMGALLAAFVLLLAHAVARVAIAYYTHRAKRRPGFRAMVGLLDFLTRLGVYSVALLVVLAHFGVAITPLLGAFGIGALAVALALQDTLANFFAGLYLSLDRPLRPGDFLEIDGGALGKIQAYVLEVGWRSVRLRELSNNVFVIPNTRMATGVIKNYDLPESEQSIVLQCSVAYASDLRQVEKVVIDVAKQCQMSVTGATRTHDPFIRYHTFGDDGIKFSIILRVETFVDNYLLTHEFFKALHERFRDEGIVIPFPQRTLHVPGTVKVEADGNGAAPFDHVRPREDIPRQPT